MQASDAGLDGPETGQDNEILVVLKWTPLKI